MTSHLYIIDSTGKAVIEHDLLAWAQWMGDIGHRRVALTPVGDTLVSTVFLGVDHNFSEGGPPLLWETMTFPDQGNQDRCSGSLEQAEAMHARMVNAVKQKQQENK